VKKKKESSEKFLVLDQTPEMSFEQPIYNDLDYKGFELGQDSTIDLSLFTNNQFFDLDVFADGVTELKPEVVDPSPQNDISVSQTPILSVESSPDNKVQKPLDDKRRRNTAASARFRMKKKQKGKEMEEKAKQLTETVERLNQRIRTLEMENKCLKNLMSQRGAIEDTKDSSADPISKIAGSTSNYELLKLLKSNSNDDGFTMTHL